MEEKIRNDAENNTENKKKLTSHLDELVDSMTTKPGCGPVFSGLNVLPDMIKEYDMLDEMIKNDPALAEEMRRGKRNRCRGYNAGGNIGGYF